MSRRSSTQVALLGVLIVACGGTSRAASPAPSIRVEEAPATAPRVCRVTYLDTTEQHTLDADGRVVLFSQNGGGSQWTAEYEYDARGRRIRIRGELMDYLGALDVRPVVEPTYAEDETARTVVVRHPEPDLQRVRWTYDVRGLPIRRQELGDDGEPSSTLECTYDERGRVTDRDGARFDYRGEAALPVALDDGGPFTITATPGRIELRLADRPEPYEGEENMLNEFEMDLVGDCVDVFFAPCGPMSAPPPPGRARAALPRP